MPPTGPETGCLDAGRGWRGETLDTARLVLRPARLEDAAPIARLASDPELARYTRIPHPLTPEAAGLHIAGTGNRDILLLAERRVDGALLGAVRLTTGEDAEEARIGYWIARDFWNHGYATEAVRRVLRMAFDQLGVACVTADVVPENAASVRVLEGLGFADTCRVVACETWQQTLEARRYVLAAKDWRARHAARPLLLVVAAALVDADGRVLLTRRPEGKPLAGLWEFPGGKVHQGEMPEAALIRELHEEIGVDVTAACLAPLAFASHDYDRFHLLMPLYVCRNWRGNVAPREGQATAWVRPARLSDYPMPPADVPLVALLRDWL